MTGRISVLTNRLEPVLLILVGAGAGWLSFAEQYAVLMNPRFRCLTTAGALIVLFMGVTAFFKVRKASLAAVGAFFVFGFIVLLGRPLSDRAASLLMTVPQAPDVPILEDPEFPLMEMRDVQAAIEETEHSADGMAFTALGMAKHLPAMEGEIALMRSYMICCAADALALGFRMAGDEVGTIQDGDWIVVSGRLAKLPEPVEVPAFRMGASSFPSVSSRYVFQTVRIVGYTSTFPSLAEQLSSDSVTLFAQLLESAGLMPKLEREGPFTVFAPINAALENSDPASMEPGALKAWLSWHIVEGGYMERDLFRETALRTIDGRELPVRVENGKVFIEGARLVFEDIRARNGAVHMIFPCVKEVP